MHVAYAMTRSIPAAMITASIVVGVSAPARANVISDWDEKALAVVAPMPPYTAQRLIGMVHLAMFDAVNSIERRYRPYLVELKAERTTAKEAAAATAAATVLATIDPKTAGDMKAALASYLASIPDGKDKLDGVQLGEAVALRIVEARTNDGSEEPDAYRPRTTPGVYVPTPITAASAKQRRRPDRRMTLLEPAI